MSTRKDWSIGRVTIISSYGKLWFTDGFKSSVGAGARAYQRGVMYPTSKHAAVVWEKRAKYKTAKEVLKMMRGLVLSEAIEAARSTLTTALKALLA